MITWGGLRGAVGLALALVVAQTPDVSLPKIGSKVRNKSSVPNMNQYSRYVHARAWAEKIIITSLGVVNG